MRFLILAIILKISFPTIVTADAITANNAMGKFLSSLNSFTHDHGPHDGHDHSKEENTQNGEQAHDHKHTHYSTVKTKCPDLQIFNLQSNLYTSLNIRFPNFDMDLRAGFTQRLIRPPVFII